MFAPSSVLRSCQYLAIVLLGLFGSRAPQHASAQETTPKLAPVGMLMQSMFSPDRAPPHKTMGLAQRSFMDLAATSQKKLQIALVIDGTESMGDNLNAAKQTIGQMASDLSGYRMSEITYQLVVYRDAGAGEGSEVRFPLEREGKTFTAEIGDLQRALETVNGESGAPYFPEVVDLGLHAALTELPWSDDEQTTRWILLFGDAPPFASGFAEEKTGARRRYATDQLVALANRKNILINCVLCTSREREQKVYEKSLPELQQFMSTLSTETGGLMVDLSYRDIRSTLETAAKKQILTYQAIDPISREDVDRVRSEAQVKKLPEADGERTKIAILPHLPLSEMSFDPLRDEVRVAAELRQKFREVPGTDVKSASTVKSMFTLLQRRKLSDTQMLQMLAERLRVDYIIWGQVKPLNPTQGTLEFQSAVYSRETGEQIATSAQVRANTKAKPAENLTGDLALSLINNVGKSTTDPQLASRFRLVGTDAVRKNVMQTVAVTPTARDQVWTALELLEQATGYLADEPEGIELVARAETALQQALDPAEGDPRSPMAHLLRSVVLFNQSQTLALKGDKELARQKAREMVNALNLANREKGRADDTMQIEIEADYALFAKKDFPEAIKAYERLTGTGDNGEPRLHTALRAHWMLAGIYSGDWGIPKDQVQQEKARGHLLQILAFWPDSPEAAKIRRYLRWDEQEGKTDYPQFPRQGEKVTDLIST